MRFTYDLKQISGCVGMAARGAASKAVLPILTHVMITAGVNGVRFSGCDLEMMISAGVPVAPEVSGACCVPGRVLQDILQALPASGEVTFATEAPYLVLTAGKAAYRLHMLPAEEFPDFPKAAEAVTLTLAGADWLTLCRRAGYCSADPGEGKAILESMSLQAGGGRLAAASTDSHRLAVMSLPCEVPELSAILPARLVAELLKLTDPKLPVALTIGQSSPAGGDPSPIPSPERRGETAPMLTARMGGVEVTARLIQGTFPDWQRVIPQEAPIRATCGRLALLAALKRAGVMARLQSGKVILQNELGALAITTGNDAGSAREEVENATACEWKAAFNVTYLLEALQVSEADQVTIGQASALLPALIGDGDARWTSVVMPMAGE